MRVLTVGDIHGALKALEQCLERCGYDPANDQIIFLGDYVDGWSESAELVEYLIDLNKEADERHVFIRGNHDEWCNEWLKTGVRNDSWYMLGGKSTIDSYVRTGHIVDHSHHMFFYKLHNYYIDEQNRGFVHGGFNSRKGLGHETYQSDYYWDRDLWQLALMSHVRVHEETTDDKGSVFMEGPSHSRRFDKHKEIFLGHTTTNNWHCKPHYPEYNELLQECKNGPITVPMNRCNVWNMDTGSGFRGKLTIMDVDTKEFWQSDFVHTLYPNERGR